MVYEELKKAARGSLGARLGGTGEISSAEISVMGAASKLVASVVTYPSQVRRTYIFLALSASWIALISLCNALLSQMRTGKVPVILVSSVLAVLDLLG